LQTLVPHRGDLLAGDLLGRRRPVTEAVELFGSTHPAWPDYLTSDRFLNPAQFQQHYGAVFPRACTTTLYRARALCWDAPPTHQPTGGVL